MSSRIESRVGTEHRINAETDDEVDASDDQTWLVTSSRKRTFEHRIGSSEEQLTVTHHMMNALRL